MIYEESNGGTVTGYDEQFHAITGTDDFLIYGGQTLSANMLTQIDMSIGKPQDDVAILVRMDLDKNTRRWAKTFYDNGAVRSIAAITLNPVADKLAVYASEVRNLDFTLGRERGFIFMIRTIDGSLLVTAQKIKVGAGDKKDYFIASDGMYLTASNKLLMTTFLLVG